MDEADKILKELDLKTGTPRDLRLRYVNYTTKSLIQILENFCKSPEGANAAVMMLMPEGRSPFQTEFNIREIRLVENKLVNAAEKYRLAILVE
jgi:hypothetical protein